MTMFSTNYCYIYNFCSPLGPGLTTPTAGLGTYPDCFPLASAGGAVGRVKTLVGWLGWWGEGLLGLLAERVGRMYWTCVMGFWPAGGAREAVGKMCGCSRGTGTGPLLWVGVMGEVGFWGGGVISCTAGGAWKWLPKTKLVTNPPWLVPAAVTGLGEDEV